MPRSASSTAVQAHIDRMVRRAVKKFRPERVVPFGPHARGEAGPDSDVERQPGPKDIVVITPGPFAWRKEAAGTIEWPVAREGQVLYARP